MTSELFAKVPEAVLYDAALHHVDVHLYAVLARHVNTGNGDGECWIGQRAAGARIGLSEDQAYRSIRRLKDGGHIDVVRRGRGRTAVYRLGAFVTGKNRAQSAGHDSEEPRPERGTRTAATAREMNRAQSAGRNESHGTRAMEREQTRLVTNAPDEVEPLLAELGQTHGKQPVADAVEHLLNLGIRYEWPSSLRDGITKRIAEDRTRRQADATQARLEEERSFQPDPDFDVHAWRDETRAHTQAATRAS